MIESSISCLSKHKEGRSSDRTCHSLLQPFSLRRDHVRHLQTKAYVISIDVSYSALPSGIPGHDKVSLKILFAPFDIVHKPSLPLVAYITPSTGLPGDRAFSPDEIESCVADISISVGKMVERHDQLVGQLNSNEESQAGSRLPCYILVIAGFIVTQEKLQPFRGILRDWLLSKLDSSEDIARSSKSAIKHIVDAGLQDEIMKSLKRSIQLTEEVKNILKPDKKIKQISKMANLVPR